MQGFIDEFFDQNPISQMGIIITKNKRAEKISELAGNPRKHIKVLVKCILMHASISTSGPDSVVRIATGYRLGGAVIESP